MTKEYGKIGMLKSMWTYHCPRCRCAKMYKEPFELSNPLNMHESCRICAQKFEPEPGFYFGAMFVSYVLSGWFFVIIALITVFGFGWSVNQTMLLILFLGALTYLRFLRFSRSMWIHFMVKYDKRYGDVLEERHRKAQTSSRSETQK